MASPMACAFSRRATMPRPKACSALAAARTRPSHLRCAWRRAAACTMRAATCETAMRLAARRRATA
eukprot:scaffold6767_cov223-Isochrysis_galbana.AAC.8